VATDIAVFTVIDEDSHDVKRLPERKLRILLIKRGEYPYKDCYALPGGFLRKGETIDACAKRELEEETHISCDYLQQIRTNSKSGRDPRGWIISVEYMALRDMPKQEVVGDSDATEAKWFDISLKNDGDSGQVMLELSADGILMRSTLMDITGKHDALKRYEIVSQDKRLAFDHSELITIALMQLREWIDTTGIGFCLVPERFTLTQLQQIYEAVKGKKLLAPAFRRKMQRFIMETELKEDDGHNAHRPARLFTERGGNSINSR